MNYKCGGLTEVQNWHLSEKKELFGILIMKWREWHMARFGKFNNKRKQWLERESPIHALANTKINFKISYTGNSEAKFKEGLELSKII